MQKEHAWFMHCSISLNMSANHIQHLNPKERAIRALKEVIQATGDFNYTLRKRKIHYQPGNKNFGAQIGSVLAISAGKTVDSAKQLFIDQRDSLYLINNKFFNNFTCNKTSIFKTYQNFTVTSG